MGTGLDWQVLKARGPVDWWTGWFLRTFPIPADWLEDLECAQATISQGRMRRADRPTDLAFRADENLLVGVGALVALQ